MKNIKTFDYALLCNAVTDFSELGTGRDKKKVILGESSDDARVATFLSVKRIAHNWPSWGEIEFTNGQKPSIANSTIGWPPRRVFIF